VYCSSDKCIVVVTSVLFCSVAKLYRKLRLGSWFPNQLDNLKYKCIYSHNLVNIAWHN